MNIFFLPVRKWSASLALFLLIGLATHSHAQVQTGPGAQGLPGAVQQQIQQPDALHVNPLAPQLEAPPEPEIDRKPRPEETDTSLTRKFLVKEIELQGGKHLPGDEAQKLIADYEGKELSFVELRQLADKLTELYQAKGYVTSMVYIGPQRIENGKVILTASEGVVGSLNYKEGKYFKKYAVLPRLDVTDRGVFQLTALKRSLRRINDNPDIKIHATLEPGELPEQTNVELELTEEHIPFHITPFWDNLGRESIGYQRFGITTTHNNMIGVGDQAYNNLYWSRRSFGVTTHYGMPIGAHGTWVNFDHSYSTLTVNPALTQGTKVKGNAKIYSPSILQEIYNSDRVKISLDTAFDFMDIQTTLNGNDLSNDQLRILRPGINWDSFDRWGRTLMRHEFGIGLDMLGARPNNNPESSRQGAGSQFFRYTANVTRLQRMPWNSFAIIRAATQLTPDKLVSAQQFQSGGAFTVRGYAEGQFIGDNGYMFSGEWRMPMYLLPKSWTLPKTKYSLRDNIQLVSFLDFGATRTHNPGPGVSRKDYMMGTGVGLRANLTKHIAGRVDLGIPLIEHDGPDARIHFGLETRLF